jgi:hypothetical protein
MVPAFNGYEYRQPKTDPILIDQGDLPCDDAFGLYAPDALPARGR